MPPLLHIFYVLLAVLVSLQMVTDISPRPRAVAAELCVSFSEDTSFKQNTASALTEYISHFLVIFSPFFIVNSKFSFVNLLGVVSVFLGI